MFSKLIENISNESADGIRLKSAISTGRKALCCIPVSRRSTNLLYQTSLPYMRNVWGSPPMCTRTYYRQSVMWQSPDAEYWISSSILALSLSLSRIVPPLLCICIYTQFVCTSRCGPSQGYCATVGLTLSPERVVRPDWSLGEVACTGHTGHVSILQILHGMLLLIELLQLGNWSAGP